MRIIVLTICAIFAMSTMSFAKGGGASGGVKAPTHSSAKPGKSGKNKSKSSGTKYASGNATKADAAAYFKK